MIGETENVDNNEKYNEHETRTVNTKTTLLLTMTMSTRVC